MKKTLVLSILGLTAAAVSSYGQGSIVFDTYNTHATDGTITTYASSVTPAGLQGLGIDSTFTGELLWSTVNIADTATSGTVAAGSALSAGWNVGSVGTFFTGSANAAGYIIGPNLDLTSTQLGGVNANLTLFFEVVAFTGASYATAGGYAGHSATFQATLVQSPTLPNADQLNNMAAFSVYNVTSVPEPSTLALAGLGGFGMLMAMRRKQA